MAERLKLWVVVIIRGLDAIQRQHMEVDIEIEAAARPVNERDGARGGGRRIGGQRARPVATRRFT